MYSTIIEKIGKNTRVVHSIVEEPTTPKSYASALLLKEQYQDLDITFDQQNDWRYYFIVRRHFLRKVKRNGHWTCHYCGKPVYKMPERNKVRQNVKDCITVDHKIPASECNDILDTSNYVESCYHCNQEKDTMLYEDFITLKRKEKTINLNCRIMKKIAVVILLIISLMSCGEFYVVESKVNQDVTANGELRTWLVYKGDTTLFNVTKIDENWNDTIKCYYRSKALETIEEYKRINAIRCLSD